MSGIALLTTCSCGSCALSCTEHAHPPLMEQRDEYWKTPQGIIRRIKFLSQDFTYKSVNGAIRIYGKENKVKWLGWLTVGDDNVCVICQKAAAGGRSGFYQANWFLPEMPAHAGCRCQWIVYFLKPTTQSRLP